METGWVEDGVTVVSAAANKLTGGSSISKTAQSMRAAHRHCLIPDSKFFDLEVGFQKEKVKAAELIEFVPGWAAEN